jgi:hypothetical protein
MALSSAAPQEAAISAGPSGSQEALTIAMV